MRHRVADADWEALIFRVAQTLRHNNSMQTLESQLFFSVGDTEPDPLWDTDVLLPGLRALFVSDSSVILEELCQPFFPHSKFAIPIKATVRSQAQSDQYDQLCSFLQDIRFSASHMLMVFAK